MLFLYVDEIVATGEERSDIQVVEEELSRKFDVQTTGNLRSSLKLLVFRKPGKAYLSQHIYAKPVPSRTGTKSCRPANTSMYARAFKAFEQNCGSAMSKQLHQAFPGSLLFFATGIRPEISAAVYMQCCDSSDSRQAH